LENWELKIKGILSLQTDIILLSDIRLKRKDGLDVTNKLKAAMLKYSGRKYDLWENSTKKGRGVGILIARDIGATILDGCEDQDQNIIMLSLVIRNQTWIIGSIYGPNGACPFFYRFLNAYLKSMQSKLPEPALVVLGGDNYRR
jgi:exonuclease III